MSKLVLSLCDKSGNMILPWLEAGYECMIVDTQHPKGIKKTGNLTIVGADITKWLPPKTDYQIVFAFPPCTNLATSGARWFPDKGLTGLIEGLQTFEACIKIAEWSQAPYMIENPVSTISTYYRKPDHIFHPTEYAGYLQNPEEEAYQKRTCLWTGNGFQIPDPKPVPATNKNYIVNMGQTKNRAEKRSITPQGFANAVYQKNRPNPLATKTTP